MVKGVIFADVGQVSRVVVMQPSGNAAWRLRSGQPLNPGQECSIYFDGVPLPGTIVQIPWYREGDHCRPFLSHLFILTWGPDGAPAGSVFMCDYNEQGTEPCCRLWEDCSGTVVPVPTPQPRPTGYRSVGAYACFGGADYPQAWRNEATCNAYGCNFGTLNRNQCLALGASKGAREVVHGTSGGGRSNECWLQNSCADVRPHTEFVSFRAGQSSPQPTPRPTQYQNRGAYACFGGAVYPQAWQNEATCNANGCFFGRLSAQECLALGSGKGAGEVIHGDSGGGRSNECWLQTSCTDLRSHQSFTLFRR